MPVGSLLTLLDDIASVLDDVAVLTKIAAKKTSGVLGDDLALNAEQVTGATTDREWPVIWSVAKGSAVNKAILVPGALAISAVLPFLITPLLMVGGSYLCFEGVEKVLHTLELRRERARAKATAGVPEGGLVTPGAAALAAGSKLDAPAPFDEAAKIKGAIRTDFILSAEIIIISLGVVAAEPLMTRIAVLALIAVLMTVGVYGLVALIVKIDDVGVFLAAREGGAARALGKGLLRGAPLLMKGLSVAGTAAMFLVGGGIVTHGIPPVHHLVESLGDARRGALVATLGPSAVNVLVGAIVGAVLVAIVTLVRRVRGVKPAH